MLGQGPRLVESPGLFGVRSGLDKAPSCSRQPGSPSPPPCQLHRATRLRSHPSHFASTAPFPPHHLSRSKCEGVSPPPGSSLRFPTNITVICPFHQLGGKDNPPPPVISIAHHQGRNFFIQNL